MFDLRYHVASLAAVFVALLIGILVGVAMSGKVDDAEKQSLQSDVNRLEAQLDAASERRVTGAREQKAFRTFVKNAYPALIADRLPGKRIAIVFVGPVDASIRRAIERTIDDAGSSAPLRIRALKVPIDPSKIDGELDGELAEYRSDGLADLGGELARELVGGGDTPAWDALTPLIVEEQAGSLGRPADGVVVARTVKAQQGETAEFLRGFYSELAALDVPTIGVEPSGVSASAVGSWSDAGLSTVDDIEAPAGRLALALLLSGSPIGNYGLKETADDGIVPPVEAQPSE
jgi:Copper transport outer membrane protein, MctB